MALKKKNTEALTEEEQYYESQNNKITAKLAKYDKSFNKSKTRQIFGIAVAAIVVLSLAFQLKLIPIIAITIACLLITPKIMISLAENRYEEQKFLDVTSYIEQMLYSFRRNSKILTSLEDTILLFPEGEMHDAIAEAIEYIRSFTTEGNIYVEALSIIEEHFDCRRIKSLHRYLTRVEGIGGNHDMGVQALIKDRKMWMDRIDEFRKEKSAIIKDVIISTVFSSVVSVITLYMLPGYVDAPHHPVIQAYATFYIIANLLNIKAVLKRLTLHVNDLEDIEHDKRMVRKLEEYKNYDVHAQRMKSIPMLVVGLLAAVIGLFMTGFTKYVAIAMGLFIAVFGFVIQPKTKYNSMRKTLVSEIETVFPDWLLELALLLQTDNLHVALEKTLPTAPLLIRGELQKLSDEIIINPTEVRPFMEFFNYLPLGNIHSSMKLLYSISEFGSQDEQKQIAELIERNSSLMNKAEEHKNQGRLSRVFMLKFVPMGTSTLKMIVDMGVFLIVFITQAMSMVNGL